jgi:hypothetical protein
MMGKHLFRKGFPDMTLNQAIDLFDGFVRKPLNTYVTVSAFGKCVGTV